MQDWLYLPMRMFMKENTSIQLKYSKTKRINFQEFLRRKKEKEEERKHFEFLDRYLKHTGVFK